MKRAMKKGQSEPGVMHGTGNASMKQNRKVPSPGGF